MAISVRIPPRVEQRLADYCASHKVTKSKAVIRALDQMLGAAATKPSPYDLGREFFERNLRTRPSKEVARHTKRLLKEHFRGKQR